MEIITIKDIRSLPLPDMLKESAARSRYGGELCVVRLLGQPEGLVVNCLFPKRRTDAIVLATVSYTPVICSCPKTGISRRSDIRNRGQKMADQFRIFR